MKINQENFREVLKGISLICGGGGGNPSEAEERMNEVLGEVEINDLDDFEDEDVLVSIFGVGGLKTKERNVKKTIQKGLDEFKQEFEIKPAGVIPVEVGAGSVSEALIAANALKLPLANADIVGMRCAPEIYLETITLADISRTPLIAVSPDREIVSIKQTKGYEELEEKLRSLSSNKIWYVMGYPIEKKE